jgi:hypothetical protein
MRVIIPTDLSEIKLSQYLRYKKVVADNSDDDTFVCIQMVAIFCNLTVAEVMQIPVNDFTDIVENIAKVLDQKPKLVRTFKMDGVHYGFIPNIDKISLGEHATIDTLLGTDENLPLLMSVMYRRITKKALPFYEIELYDGDESRAVLFKETPMDVVISSMLFFWTLSKELLANILLHLESKAMREGVHLEEVLANDGGGINHLLELRENLIYTFEKLEESLFTSHLRYYRI